MQSQQFSPEHVLNSTNRFLQSFYDDTVTSQDFADNFMNSLNVLKQTLNKQDLNLKDKTDKIWNQILSGQNQFSFVDQQVGVIGNLNVEAFREFYRRNILEQGNRRKLVIVVYGKDKEFEPPAQYSIQYGQLDQTNNTLPIQQRT